MQLIRFHPQTQQLKPSGTAKTKKHHNKVLLIQLNGLNRFGFKNRKIQKGTFTSRNFDFRSVCSVIWTETSSMCWITSIVVLQNSDINWNSFESSFSSPPPSKAIRPLRSLLVFYPRLWGDFPGKLISYISVLVISGPCFRLQDSFGVERCCFANYRWAIAPDKNFVISRRTTLYQRWIKQYYKSDKTQIGLSLHIPKRTRVKLKHYRSNQVVMWQQVIEIWPFASR